MFDDAQVQQLLDELFNTHRTPEEVCVAHPELLPEVRERWRQIRVVEADLDAIFPPPLEPGGSAQAPTLKGPAFPNIPGYELEAVIGRGGMGIVFRARDVRLKRLVALKMVLAGEYAGPQERMRFQREAEAVAGLRHPNIVQIHDIGDSDGRPYFTMEYVEGGGLAQKLAGTPQPSRDAASLVATLAVAVQAAHTCKIIHRDLKPGNVLLTADGTPKISDFGLARRVDGETALTRTGIAVGTPSYMAPEQAVGIANVGTAVDIYALGAILYELLTGRPPFLAETAAQTIQHVIAQDPVPPSRLNATVPRDLETICLKCLRKEPGLRYISASALADDLQRFLHGEAIAARPEGRFERFIRRVRRRPAISAAIAAVTLLSVALVGGGAWTLSDREATARAAKAAEDVRDSSTEDDLREMSALLRKKAWIEAKAALERAKGRLGDNRDSPELRRRMDQGLDDLKLAARLDEIRLNGPSGDESMYKDLEIAFARIGKLGDDPEIMARRIRESDIRQALVDALDFWAAWAHVGNLPKYEAPLLALARKADPDPNGWRDRFRDPRVRKNKAELAALADSAKVDSTPVNLLVALGHLLFKHDVDAIPFLVKVQRHHPDDVWVNYLLGHITTDPKDSLRYYQAALALRPDAALLNYNAGFCSFLLGNYDEAAFYYSKAVRLDPVKAEFRTVLGATLLKLNREREALEQIQQGLALKPDATTFKALQESLKLVSLRHARWEEAQRAWKLALKTSPSDHGRWYGYAELCLFLGKDEEYRLARQALLARFGSAVDPYIAERTGRASLLLPISGDELRQTVALADRAVATDPKKYPEGLYPYLHFVKGLAEYRQGRFEQAIAAMRGDASRVPSPAPRLVLAMALHKTGQTAAARKTLAAAILAFDWRAGRVRDQDGWIVHTLRREAESMMLPNLPAFLEGKHEPQDHDERLALIGVCQFTNRWVTLARLYADVLDSDSKLAEDFRLGHRFYAACAAAQASCVAELREPERAKWRTQARQWLRADLVAWKNRLDQNLDKATTRDLVRQRLTQWQSDPDLGSLREPTELVKLPAQERNDCVALWEDLGRVVKATQAK